MNKKQLSVIIGNLLLGIALSSCNSNAGKDNNGNSHSNFIGKSANATNATSQEWKYTYNAKKLLETVTDPNGNVTRYDYTPQGDVSKITNALNQSISFSDFTEDGNPQTIIDQNGITTKLTYTVDGWLATSTTDGATTKYDYDNIGQLKKITSPDNSDMSYVYDDARRLMEVHGMNGVIKYTRDNGGNPTQIKILDKSDNITFSEYRTYHRSNMFGLSNLASIKSATKNLEYWYNSSQSAFGDLRLIKSNGNTWIFHAEYDNLQRVVTLYDSNNRIMTTYTYDNANSLTEPVAIKDAKGNTTTYDINGLSNLLKLVSPDSGTHQYTAYDGNGNLLEQLDPNGKAISYTYDALNRPKTITYTGDPVSNTIFTYDSGSYAVGKLSKVQNGNSSNSYYYDPRGNTTGEVQRIDNTDYSLTYAYDKADNLTNIVYPDKTQVAYTYTNGQISKVIVNGKTIANITHLPFGPINQIVYGNGVTEDLGYTTDYRIQSLKLSNDLLDRIYSYNPISNPYAYITSISGVNKYEYDDIYRNGYYRALTTTESKEYYYDSLLNRTQVRNNKVWTTDSTYLIATTSNRILSSKQGNNETKYEYDNAGNIIKAGTTNYTYDNLNRLKEVSLDDLQNGKQLASYQYNSFSQRIVKDVNGNKTIFIYNSAGQLLEEINKPQNISTNYIYADGQLIAMVQNGQVLYIVTDHLNAPQIMMDSNGRQIWSAKYEPFGKATVTGNIKLNLRADGQYQDDETGLYYNWYRYYNPELGRYITSDPMGLAAGMNTYIYVNGNPINYTDPTGQCPWCVGAGFGAITEIGNQWISNGIGSKLNWADVGLAALSGAGGGFIAGRMPLSKGLLKSLSANLIGNYGLGALQQIGTNVCHGNDDILAGVNENGINNAMYSLFGIGAYGAVRGGYLGGDYIVRVIKSQPDRYIRNTNAPVFTNKVFSRENVEKGFYILGNGASNIVPTVWQWRDISKNKN